MMKKLMFLVAMVAGLFASCTDNTVVDNNQDEGAKKIKLSINASVAGSRVGFTPNGEGLKGSFQEGDYMMVYFRTADGKWLNKTCVLNYEPGTAGKFSAQIAEIPEGTGLLHILIGTTKGGTPYIDAAAGKCALINDLSKQEGTLEDAAMRSVFQADPLTEGNLDVNTEKNTATLNNVTFKPKTSVLKLQLTFPEGATVAKGTELTVQADATYNKVQISGGNPGGASTPAGAKGKATFTVKVGEVSGNVATAYMTIWPNVNDNEFSTVNISTEIDGKKYAGEYLKEHAAKLEAGKLYTVATAMAKQKTEKTIWVKDNEADVADAVDGTVNSEADWLTYAAGKVHAKANETGAPRTGVITVGDTKFTITQIEPKDFKGTYTFTTKVFAYANSFKPAADPSSWDVTFTDPRKAVTLTDADGETKHTNNIGIKGLCHDAIMDACVEIDYELRTVKVGLFCDARDGEGQLESTLNKYVAFVPELSTRSAKAWGAPYVFSETELGDPDYAWIWYTVSADMKTISYVNRTNNNVEFTTLSQYNSTINYICGIAIVTSPTNVFDHTTVNPNKGDFKQNNGTINIYQVNAKGKPGTSFVRK